jgi:hypothetical protein
MPGTALGDYMSDHISNVSIKINQRIGLLRRVKVFIPLKARLTIYNSLIFPLFDYADIIWGDKKTPPSWINYKSFRTRLQRRFLTLLTYPPPLKLSQTYTAPTYPPAILTSNADHIQIEK